MKDLRTDKFIGAQAGLISLISGRINEGANNCKDFYDSWIYAYEKYKQDPINYKDDALNPIAINLFSGTIEYLQNIKSIDDSKRNNILDKLGNKTKEIKQELEGIINTIANNKTALAAGSQITKQLTFLRGFNKIYTTDTEKLYNPIRYGYPAKKPNPQDIDNYLLKIIDDMLAAE